MVEACADYIGSARGQKRRGENYVGPLRCPEARFLESSIALWVLERRQWEL